MECPERFKRERVLRQAGGWEYSQSSARGTIIHKFMETLINHRILDGDWIAEDNAKALLDSYWDDGFPINEDGITNILDSCIWVPDFIERSKEQSSRLVEILYEDVLPMLTPIGSEVHLEMPLWIPGKEIKTLHGYIDCLAEPNLIIDWKTRTSTMNTRWLDVDMQATIYAALSGYAKVRVQFVQFIFPSRGNPKIEIASTQRDSNHVDWLMTKVIPPIIHQIENDIIGPQPGWWCDNCPVKCGAYPELDKANGLL